MVFVVIFFNSEFTKEAQSTQSFNDSNNICSYNFR
jgi:hypothetical protein